MIIIFGGSFNPPTIAHYKISKYLLQKYKPKHFIFVPVGNNYEKTNLTDFKYRYQMVQIMSNKLKNAFVSDFENQDNFQGTIYTLDYFQNKYQDETLYYVIGADNLLTLTSWVDRERLLNTYKFIVLNRNKIAILDFIKSDEFLQKYQDAFLIEDNFPEINVSASDYRMKKDDSLVLPEVNEYIYKNNLYDR